MKRKRQPALGRVTLGLVGLVLGSFAVLAQDDKERPDESSSPPIEQMSEASELVVIGRVLRNESRWVGKLIVTTSEVQPLQTLKGDHPGETLKVSFYGGTVGVINQHVTHEAILQEDEVAVLFLAQPDERAAERAPGLRIVHERGALRLLDPGADESRLKDNRRLQRYLEEIAERVRKGEQ